MLGSCLSRAAWTMYLGSMRAISTFGKFQFVMIVSMASGLGALGGGCESNDPAEITVTPPSLTLSVGEEGAFDVQSEMPWSSMNNCDETAVTLVEEPGRIVVRALRESSCTVTTRPVGQFDTEIATNTITVRAVADSGAEDASAVDAGALDAAPDAAAPSDAEAGPPAICAVPVAKINTVEGRDLYMAYTDVDSGPQDQVCPLHTSTDYRGDIVFSFLSGSPGYSIDGRGNYEILTAEGAELLNDDFSSSANALEGDIVSITFRRRVFDDEDAGVVPGTWSMRFRMVPDPDPAQWKVELYAFAKL